MSNSRSISLDIMKGIAILLTISCHLFPNWGGIWGKLADSFSVPLFFIVGGYLHKDRPFKSALNKDFKRLIVPYVITQICLIVWYLFLFLVRSGSPELHLLKITSLSTLWGCSPGGPGHLSELGVGPTWFLLALFWCRQVARLLIKTGEKYCFPLSLVVSIIATIFAQKVFFLPWGILQGLSAIIFYILGWYAQKGLLPKSGIIASIICWPFAILKSSIHLHVAHYGNYLLSVMGGLGGTYCIYNASKVLSRIPFLNVGLTFCGINSLLLLCIHDFERNSHIIRTIEIHTVALTEPLRIAFAFLFVLITTLLFNFIRKQYIYSSQSS